MPPHRNHPQVLARCLLRRLAFVVAFLPVALGVARASEIDYLNLTLPVVGDHTLHVLAPTMLELVKINSKPPGVAPVDNWDFVDSNNQFQGPALSDFAVTVDGVPATVIAIGFKRRPIYAPVLVRDLRIANSLYLQLSVPIADGQFVEVRNPNGQLWTASESYTATTDPLRYSPAIHVNQEGYVPGLPKKAMIGYYLGDLGELNVAASLGFKIVVAGTGTLVFQGAMTVRADVGYLYTPTPYQAVLEADFSSVTAPGTYQLVVPGLGASLPFVVDEGMAMNFLRTYALGLYAQRCGTDNVMPFTRFVHDACHIAPAAIPSPQANFSFTWSTISGKNGDFATNPRHTAPQLDGEAAQLYPFVNHGVVDVSGGHHDAGDYSKYTINSAALAHLLLFTADAIPGAGALDNLGIPESGDGISDILQEAKQETDYLAKLQDADGGFYFIVYPKEREYESNVLPDQGDAQVVWPKNTAATAAAVAALAQASSSPRFKAAYPAVAALYLRKAKLGWQFLMQAIAAHGKDGAYQKITFYGDNFMHDDELAWAACELFVATGEAQYRQKLFEWFPDPSDGTKYRFGWLRMSESWGNAIRSYAFAARTGRLAAGQLDAAYLALCEGQIVAAGDDALRWSNQNAYASSFPEETKHFLAAGFYFSLDQASDMAVAYQLAPKAAYLDALVGNMNYEGGSNPVNVTYLTGLGRKRQREIVSQYALNDRRVLPPDGIPIGNIQGTFAFLSLYGSELRALAFPSDSAVVAPYEFYDRWADSFNVSTEYIAVNQARGLLALTVLATRTTTQTQVWKSGVAQITAPTGVALLNAPVTLTVQAPGFNLTGARIVWEARDQEAAFGPVFTISPKNNGPQWVEAEIALPDGRRLFATNSFNANSTVVNWVAGAVPAGGITNVLGGDAWTWITASPATPSGLLAHQSNLATGEHAHWFDFASATMDIGLGDEMFAWVYLDPLNPPTEVMLTWSDASTEHRAYWGANTITWGTNNSAGRYHAGALPPVGQWVRLSVPASAVGLAGSTVAGMAFVLVDGRATWDTAGIATAVAPATAPAFTNQPLSQITTIGAGASFTIAATGTAPLTYQWTLDGAPLSGATSATLVLTNAQVANAGNYAVVATNAIGSTPSNAATLTVNPGAGAPTISVQPQTQAVTVGTNVTFTVTASGTAPLTYQWRRNGAPIVGATSASFAITGAAPVRDNAWYQVVVSNASGAAVSAAAFVNVAVSPTQIVGWGRNIEGETTVPNGLSDAVGVAAGDAHTVALKADGTVVAWGRNVEGQTGVPGGLSTVVALSAGRAHTIALKANGTVVAWGANDYGQTNVPGGLSNVVSVAAGNYHSVALKSDGTVVAWGNNDSGETTPPAGLANVIAVAAGGAHTVALKRDGTVVAWGYNGAGQTNVPVGLANVVGITAGYYHSVAVKADGTVVGWGWNGYGQTTVPIGLGAIAGLAGGGAHSVAQKTNGMVVGWGDNTLGQAAVPSGLTKAFRIASGNETTLALLDARVLPVITTSPVSQSVLAGQPVMFSVVATGTPTPTYQWRKGGTPISGATNANYTIAATVVGDSGNFDVIVTNSVGPVTSMTAILTIGKTTPTITWTTPAAIVYGVALSATQLNATASAPGTFSYAPAVGTVLGAGAGQALGVTFTPTNAAIYNGAAGATTITVTPNFGSWRVAKFTAPELSDPAKSGPNAVFGIDGISNLVKYALGLDPKLDVVAGLPTVAVQSTDWVYNYARPTSVTDVIYAVEVSTNLTSWTTTGVTHELVSSADGIATWRGRYPLASAPNVFLRLKVTRSPDIASTPPLGGNTITIGGATSGVPKVTTFSLALRLPVAATFAGRARGTLTAVAATSFTDSQAGWTAGVLAQAATPYFVRIRSGAASGLWWQISTSTANTSTTVTILNRGVSPLSLGMAPGDVYEIVPGDTLTSFLGSVTAAIGGTSASTADAVRVHDGVSWREYYYNSTVSRWREGASSFDRSNTVLRPDSGVVIVRQGAGNISLRMLGAVSDANERILVNPTGVTIVGGVFPVVRTLGALNIQGMPGFIAYTGDLAVCDKVTLYDGVSWRTFQFNPGPAQWREGASSFNRNTFAVPLGSPVIIERGSGATGGAVQFILQIPYTL